MTNQYQPLQTAKWTKWKLKNFNYSLKNSLPPSYTSSQSASAYSTFVYTNITNTLNIFLHLNSICPSNVELFSHHSPSFFTPKPCACCSCLCQPTSKYRLKSVNTECWLVIGCCSLQAVVEVEKWRCGKMLRADNHVVRPNRSTQT